MKIIRKIALVCVFLANFLQAEQRTCRVVYPDRPQDAPASAYLYDGAKSHRVDLPSMNLSDVIELPEGEIKIAMVLTEISDSGQLPAEAPTLVISEDVSEFYILISPDPENKVLPVKMELIDASGGKLNAGETLWCNFTGHRITAKLGDAELTVEPKSQAISKQPVDTSGYYTASISYQVEGKGETKPITEQSWWHDANSRHLGFISYTEGQLPRIYYFRDFRIPQE
jgi:hypothetical protein